MKKVMVVLLFISVGIYACKNHHIKMPVQTDKTDVVLTYQGWPTTVSFSAVAPQNTSGECYFQMHCKIDNRTVNFLMQGEESKIKGLYKELSKQTGGKFFIVYGMRISDGALIPISAKVDAHCDYKRTDQTAAEFPPQRIFDQGKTILDEEN